MAEEKKKGNAPAVQVFMSDFFTDVAGWTTSEVGIYWRLLMNQWVKKELPTEHSRLARIAGCDVRTFRRAWLDTIAEKFKTVDEVAEMLNKIPPSCTAKKKHSKGTAKLQNYRLEESRNEQEEYRKTQANKGSKGGKVTQERRREKASTASSTASSPKKALQSSPSSSLKKPLCQTSLTLAEILTESIKKENPRHKFNFKEQTKKQKESWASEIEQMIRIEGRTPEEIKKVINFATKDNFWKPNILSAKKLRDQFDTLNSKIETTKNAPEKVNFKKEWAEVQSCFRVAKDKQLPKLQTLPSHIQNTVRGMGGLSEIGRMDDQSGFFKYLNIRKAGM